MSHGELNDSNHVFILRVWDNRADQDSPHEWRALLEHANTSERYPIYDIKTVQDFLAPHQDYLNIEGLVP
ncbi:hypothetical protein KFU94_03225 [Chloroflexi bacterium TSY]|nr:hypothetical protein [Chloroflexi bacterium TSY]